MEALLIAILPGLIQAAPGIVNDLVRQGKMTREQGDAFLSKVQSAVNEGYWQPDSPASPVSQ